MKKLIFLAGVLLLVFGSLTDKVFAGPPFNNLEGVGGVAFNPLAYLADSGEEFVKIGNTNVLAKPRFGTWYVNLPDAKIDWTSFGVATTLLKRLEISYGFQNISWEAHPTFHKNNIGAKLLVLKENSFNTKFVPAFSVGTIYKNTSNKSLRDAGISALRSSGQDWYAVATKTVTLLPVPVIISGGVLSTQEYVTGVLGFSNNRKLTGFANIDLVLPKGFVAGFEFKQGARYSAAVQNANYWDAHLAWIPNKNLTLIAAYTATGHYTGSSRQGLGNGVVLSAQYAF